MPPIPENQTPAFKAAKLAVIILSTLIILALIGAVVAGIARMKGKSASEAAGSDIQLPAGTQIVDMQSQPGRLILRLRKDGVEEIRIIDTQNGRVVGQVKAPAR